MNPQNSRYLLLALIVVCLAAVLIFSPHVAQAILSDMLASAGSAALLMFFAVVILTS